MKKKMYSFIFCFRRFRTDFLLVNFYSFLGYGRGVWERGMGEGYEREV